jgi:broad specificity phosphatase PhoE
MRLELYLVRHAQSFQKASQAFSKWQLSPVGVVQAEQLAESQVTRGDMFCLPPTSDGHVHQLLPSEN